MPSPPDYHRTSPQERSGQGASSRTDGCATGAPTPSPTSKGLCFDSSANIPIAQCGSNDLTEIFTACDTAAAEGNMNTWGPSAIDEASYLDGSTKDLFGGDMRGLSVTSAGPLSFHQAPSPNANDWVPSSWSATFLARQQSWSASSSSQSSDTTPQSSVPPSASQSPPPAPPNSAKDSPEPGDRWTIQHDPSPNSLSWFSW
ncbi:MAG: hypothetical protein M1831_000052 [Alyxoria varia]|nr:MAG: hypothetical protein M1831_000052 [Alyxoria varia]